MHSKQYFLGSNPAWFLSVRTRVAIHEPRCELFESWNLPFWLRQTVLFQMKADHCFDLAKVCRAKYRWLRAALWVCAVGLGASLVVFLFLKTAATSQSTIAPVATSPVDRPTP